MAAEVGERTDASKEGRLGAGAVAEEGLEGEGFLAHGSGEALRGEGFDRAEGVVGVFAGVVVGGDFEGSSLDDVETLEAVGLAGDADKEVALDRILWPVAVKVFIDVAVEVFLSFAESRDDDLPGTHTVDEAVQRRLRLALRGARPGGHLRVAPIGGDLFVRGHGNSPGSSGTGCQMISPGLGRGARGGFGGKWWMQGGSYHTYRSISDFVLERAEKECGVRPKIQGLIGVFRTCAEDIICSTTNVCYVGYVPYEEVVKAQADKDHSDVRLITLCSLDLVPNHEKHWYPMTVFKQALRTMPSTQKERVIERITKNPHILDELKDRLENDDIIE